MPASLPPEAPALDRIRARQLEASDEAPARATPSALTTRPRRGRRALLALGIALLVVGVAVLGGVRWLGTERGHAWIARQLEQVVSDQIRGRLIVGRIDEVDLHHVVGHDVRFEDESGRPVIEADAVEMAYELEDLLRGHFVSRASQVVGGRVWIESGPDGELLLSRTFRSAHPGAPGAPVGADVVHLENLHVSDIVVTTDIGGAPVATLRHLAAVVLVRAPENGAAIVGARHTSGRLHVEAPIPFDLRVIAASLDVDGGAHRRVHLDLPSRMGTERIGIEVTALAQPDESLTVDARIRPHGLSAMLAATGMIGQCLLAETQSDALDVTVEMQ